MNVSGHRITTIEVESALVDHKSVAEAAVVGKNDPITGQAIFAFVILQVGIEADRRAGRRAARARRQGHRADRQAEVPDVHAGPAQDPVRARSCAACCATSPKAGHWATRRRSPMRASSRRSGPTVRLGGGLSVPFDFLKRNKRKPDAPATDAPRDAPSGRQPGRGDRVRRPDRGVADRRRDGDPRPAVRRPQQARGRSRSRTSSGHRSTAPQPLVARRASRRSIRTT